ncbi:MAG: hypothetical protein WDW36_003560 [Sanguina aurantia]
MDVKPTVSVDLPRLSDLHPAAVVWELASRFAGPLLAGVGLLFAGCLGAVSMVLLAPLMFLPLMLVTPLFLASAVATYRQNVRRKEQRHAVLAHSLDTASIQALLGDIPTWLATAGGRDKLEWVNGIIAQLWPSLRLPLCDIIRREVEPVLNQSKPPFISTIGIHHLALGDVPFKLTGIQVTPLLRGADGATLSGFTSGTAAAGAVAQTVSGPQQTAGIATHTSVADEAVSNQAAAGAKAERHDSSVSGSSSGSGSGSAVSDDGEHVDGVSIEVDFAWHPADPDIGIVIGLAAPILGGEIARITPRLVNLSVSGTLVLICKPLVKSVPGFGALLLSMVRPPCIRFGLDFGAALGGRVSAAPVTAFLEPLITDVLGGVLVWPNRVVIPVLPESLMGPIEELQLRTRGVAVVTVVRARNLPGVDNFNRRSDPQVQLHVQPDQRQATSTVWNSLNPEWGETLFLSVQEPEVQALHVEVNDIDTVNLKEMLRFNVVAGVKDSFNSKTLLGRAVLPLSTMCRTPGQVIEQWVPLSGGATESRRQAQQQTQQQQQQQQQQPAQRPFGASPAPAAPAGSGVAAAVPLNFMPPQDSSSGGNLQGGTVSSGSGLGGAVGGNGRTGVAEVLLRMEYRPLSHIAWIGRVSGKGAPAMQAALAHRNVPTPGGATDLPGTGIPGVGASGGTSSLCHAAIAKPRTASAADVAGAGSPTAVAGDADPILSVAGGRQAAQAGRSVSFRHGTGTAAGQTGGSKPAPAFAGRGLLLMDVVRAEGLGKSAAESDLTSQPSKRENAAPRKLNPYVLVKVGGRSERSAPLFNTCDPAFHFHAEFPEVTLGTDNIDIRVSNFAWFIGSDELLGELQVPLTEIAEAVTDGQKGVREGFWSLGRAEGGAGDSVRGRKKPSGLGKRAQLATPVDESHLGLMGEESAGRAGPRLYLRLRFVPYEL